MEITKKSYLITLLSAALILYLVATQSILLASLVQSTRP